MSKYCIHNKIIVFKFSVKPNHLATLTARFNKKQVSFSKPLTLLLLTIYEGGFLTLV